MRISVVVPTYNRPELLDRCLSALMAQDIDRQTYEIIVADDGAEPAPELEPDGLSQNAGVSNGLVGSEVGAVCCPVRCAACGSP